MAKKKNAAMEMLAIMSEGNPGALVVLMEMARSLSGVADIIMLDHMGIYGTQLYVLYDDCCGHDPYKFKRTLMMFRAAVYTPEEVSENLNGRGIPFIDDSIKMEGIPPYEKDFGPTHFRWRKWANAQRESFLRRTA